MNRKSTPALILVVLLSAASSVVAQAPPPAPARSTASITPNFRDVPIEQLAEAVGQATGKSIIVAPNVRAQVSLINPRPMTPTELYYAFLSILQVHGFAAVPSGNLVKIVQETNAKQLPGNDLPPSVAGGPDEMVTTVIEVKNISANQLSTVLRQLMSANSVLQGIPGTNSLIITDRASNVARIQKIIARVDQTSTNGIDVIRLENATAADVVRTLNALTAGQQAEVAAGLAPRIAADDRSNSILVSGDPTQRLRIAAYVAHLDTPLENGGGTEVRYLKYAEADKVAAKLKEQATGIAAAAAGSAPGAAASVAAGDRSVTILAYKETNTLIITAPPKMMRQLWTIVDKLDIPRAQVFIEAVIADVNINKTADLGVNWAAFSKEDGTNVPAGGFIAPVAGVNIVDLTKGVLNPATATAPIGATFGIGRISDTGFNFAAMLRALAVDDTSNIIATPSITTIDNQATEFNDAQSVPFITGQYTNTGGNNNGNVNPFTTVQRQDVGTILKITPQINDANTLTLAIELESSGLAGKNGDAGSAITNKRSFKTMVRVENGSTIVVAGMIRNSKTNTDTRVPFLSRIPLVGQAFKVRNGNRIQQNLMVFIRPKIVTDGLQATIETNQKYDFIRDQQMKMNNKGEIIPLFPFDKAPQLPPTQPPASTTPVPNPGEATPKQ
jgi:general secretion pathway protein D